MTHKATVHVATHVGVLIIFFFGPIRDLLCRLLNIVLYVGPAVVAHSASVRTTTRP
jgi:hypothetical protein